MAASVAGALRPHETGPSNNPRISVGTVNPAARTGTTADPDTTTAISGLTAPV